jgi:hypothetical protein
MRGCWVQSPAKALWMQGSAVLGSLDLIIENQFAVSCSAVIVSCQSLNFGVNP